MANFRWINIIANAFILEFVMVDRNGDLRKRKLLIDRSHTTLVTGEVTATWSNVCKLGKIILSAFANAFGCCVMFRTFYIIPPLHYPSL